MLIMIGIFAIMVGGVFTLIPQYFLGGVALAVVGVFVILVGMVKYKP